MLGLFVDLQHNPVSEPRPAGEALQRLGLSVHADSMLFETREGGERTGAEIAGVLLLESGYPAG
jgi:hypothetical protein